MRGSVSRRYARALLELGIEHDCLDELQSQLRELAEICVESRDFRAIISNPSVELDERREVVTRLAERGGWNRLFRNFSRLLLDNDRFDHVAGIAEELGAFVDEHRGRVRATITTATELEDSQVASVKGAIAGMTGKDVELQTEVDPDLLGGVVTRVGSTVYDGSVRNQLESMRESILEEI